MAAGERSSNIVKSGLGWVIDFVIDKWPQMLAFILTSGGFSFLASTSAALQAYGLIGWVAVGLLMALGAAGIFAMFSYGRHRNSMASLLTSRASTASTNVLAPVHEHERINLVDFYRPGFETVSKVRFSHCELFGPMNLNLQRSTFDGIKFTNCEIVIVRQGMIKNVLRFDTCQFIDCTISGATLFLVRDEFNNYPQVLRSTLPVVSDTAL